MSPILKQLQGRQGQHAYAYQTPGSGRTWLALPLDDLGGEVIGRQEIAGHVELVDRLDQQAFAFLVLALLCAGGVMVAARR